MERLRVHWEGGCLTTVKKTATLSKDHVLGEDTVLGTTPSRTDTALDASLASKLLERVLGILHPAPDDTLTGEGASSTAAPRMMEVRLGGHTYNELTSGQMEAIVATIYAAKNGKL